MKILICASGKFSIPTIEAIHKKYGIVGLITKPDKFAGRGYKLTPTDAKTTAIKLNIKNIYQPQDINSLLLELKKLNLDIILTIDFGIILPEEFLSIARLGCINLHPSLLPAYRGPAPIQWSIIRGERITGVSLHFIKKEIDAGDIILQEEVEIQDDEDAGSLEERLSKVAATLAIKGIEKLERGDFISKPQVDKCHFYARFITSEDCHINWKDTAYNIYNLIRGLSPKPGAFCFIQTKSGIKRLKIYKVEKEEVLLGKQTMIYKPGTIIDITDKIKVATGKGNINILELQLEGRNKLKAEEFLRGHQLIPGETILI